MKTFELVRIDDETGVSGTGFVAEGVVFSSGKVSVAWNTHVRSVTVYDSIKEVEHIHGHGGATIVRYHANQPSE